MGNQATTLRPEILSDLEESTAFSADEIREYYRHFIKDTSHGSLTLSLPEFQEMYCKVFPNGDASRFAEHVFRNFDKDGDGSIDFREFVSALSVQQKGSIEEKLEWTFNLYDLDGSGFINKEELLNMIQSICGLRERYLPSDEKITPQKMADYIMKRADQNKDGQLSRREFIEGAMGSETMQKMLVGTLKASNSPFNPRKQYKKTDKK